jgi:DNA replication protein DnaC
MKGGRKQEEEKTPAGGGMSTAGEVAARLVVAAQTQRTPTSSSTGSPAPRRNFSPSSEPLPPSSPWTTGSSSGSTMPEDPVCPTCHGAGWLRQDLPFEHPQWGRLVPCDDCGAVQRQRIARLDRYSSRRGRALRQSFDNFCLGGSAAPAGEAFNAALAFAAEPRGWLVIHGPKGSGKSHLAAAITNYLIEEARTPTLFVTAPDLLHGLRAEIRASLAGDGGGGARSSELLDVAREAPVLVLDDLGAERWTAWAEEQIFLLLDYRYRLELPTVVLTNEVLERLPSRIYSRLGDRLLCRLVHNFAPDYRWGQGKVTY